MKTHYSKFKKQSKEGISTKMFGNTAAIVWNTRRRFR